MPRNRDFLESVLKEISGRDWSAEVQPQGRLGGATAESGSTRENPAPRPRTETAAAFKDDPLIREALEIFKGEIKP